ncbi:MAG TPA: diguanylate cyclase, partial [Desulfurivibrionaceae bacterium]|nr:diguanylate cyclase [Desulfurivibrionaceae bacterium]
DREAVSPHLEAVRQAVEAARFQLRKGKERDRVAKGKSRKTRSRGKTVAVTVSIGVAERQPGKQHTERTVQAADKALYRAKEAGRNRVTA